MIVLLFALTAVGSFGLGLWVTGARPCWHCGAVPSDRRHLTRGDGPS